MKSVMINKERFNFGIPEHVMGILPYRVADAIREASSLHSCEICEEIRLRRGRLSTLTVAGGRNMPIELSCPLSQGEIDLTVDRLSGGSLYAHGDTIRQGYISLRGGIRAGVCGRAAYDGGKMIGVNDISGICIRLPHTVSVNAEPVCNILRKNTFTGGVLIYSPPGEGKTTLLRAVTAELALTGEVRVVVVDSRGELEYGLNSSGFCLDILSGYSKAEGIEIALRTLNAGVIVCDEIGSRDDAAAICEAANGGAALIASAHASDIPSLTAKRNIKALVDAGVFSAFVGIKRTNEGYDYTITTGEELRAI